MTLNLYILNADGQPILETDVKKWAASGAVQTLKLTELAGMRISTIFLGIDHNHCGGKPLLWETMVFGGKMDQTQYRDYTREEALAIHSLLVARVFATLPWWCRLLARFWGEVTP